MESAGWRPRAARRESPTAEIVGGAVGTEGGVGKEECAAPTALRNHFLIFPSAYALANLCRASGAGEAALTPLARRKRVPLEDRDRRHDNF